MISLFEAVEFFRHCLLLAALILGSMFLMITAGIYLAELSMGVPLVFPPEWWPQ